MDLNYKLTFDHMVISRGDNGVGVLSTTAVSSSTSDSKQTFTFTDVNNDPTFTNISGKAYFGLAGDTVGRVVSIYGKFA
jgi:hypothetical protein